MSDAFLASIVISTYNRADALRETLLALGNQSVGRDRYEVIVVDDGSTDDTHDVLASTTPPYRLRTVRHERNSGVSAGRNSGIRIARGHYLIFVSDDLLVPDTFIEQHVRTLEEVPDSWVVGGFRQLDSLTETPFGRYLDHLERKFASGRKARAVGPDLWEMTWPTARNLSLPRADLERIGLFDERFGTCCEDQDLAERARGEGVRFIYNGAIDCLHNDQAGDLCRYCNFQRRGAGDTVLLCRKFPRLHGGSPLVKANGPVARGDGAALIVKKLLKDVLSRRVPGRALRGAIQCSERIGAPESMLWREYQIAIAVSIFRGWREGLAADIAPVEN